VAKIVVGSCKCRRDVAKLVHLLSFRGEYVTIGVGFMEDFSDVLAWADMFVFYDSPIAMINMAIEGTGVPILVMSAFEEFVVRRAFPQSKVHFVNLGIGDEELLDRVREVLSA